MASTTVNRDTALLHPTMRAKIVQVMATAEAEGLPLRIFEAWRSPERQAHLFTQGRTRPGQIVTNAQPWESYHQYGLAVDIVGFVNGNWTWDLPTATWKRMHAIGADNGLEHLSFETPHLQVANLDIHDLMQGAWPEGGDDTWRTNIANAITGWTGSPAAPPPPAGVERPPLNSLAAATGLDWSLTPSPTSSNWHSQFGGQEWRHDANGVYLRTAADTPLRTAGPPSTCSAIVNLYGQTIHKAALEHKIAPELIVMTIATEAAFAKKANFTGPSTFRWEALVQVNDVSPPTLGDYSAGPMQTLATTAREVIGRLGLSYPDPFAVAPYFEMRPVPAPATHPLYDAAPNIDIGSAEIRTRLSKTGFDPILVAAAYNAGSLRPTDENPWHLDTTGDHLNRAAAWYGDACFVLSALR